MISSHAKLSVFRPWMNYHSTKRHSSISRVGLLAYGQYVYKVEYDTTGTELERLAQVYNSLRETVIAKYSETDIGRTFLRVSAGCFRRALCGRIGVSEDAIDRHALPVVRSAGTFPGSAEISRSHSKARPCLGDTEDRYREALD